MLRHLLNPPNWFTAASLLCGVFAVLTVQGDGVGPAELHAAGLLVVLAGVFDVVDGRVARLTGTGSAFGRELDSLSDMVCFGVAPAALLYRWHLASWGVAGQLLTFVFVLCAALRLARYNLASVPEPGDRSVGLTVTMSGGTLAAMVTAHASLDGGWQPRGWGTAGLVLTLCGLMLSNLPFPTLRTLPLGLSTRAGLALVGGVLVVSSVWLDPGRVIFGAGLLYVAVGLVDAVGVARQRARGDHSGVAPV